MARKKDDLSINEKLYKVIDFLNDPANEAGICQSDFAEMFGTSRNSFLNFLKDPQIRKLGYDFTPYKSGRITYYKLSCRPEIDDYQYLEKKDYLKYCVISILRKHPEGMYLEDPARRSSRLNLPDPKISTRKREYLFDYFNFLYSGEARESEVLLPIPVSESRLRVVIEEMVDEGILLKQYTGRNGYSYSVSYDDLGHTFEFSDDILMDLYNKISQLPPGRADHDSLNSILNKLSQIRGLETPSDDADIFILYGKKYSSLKDIHSAFKRLSQFPFIDYKLMIDGYLFSVGAVVYSEEKDSVFLLGMKKAMNDNTQSYSCIDLNKVKNISATKEPNNQFSPKNQSAYNHMLNQMLSLGFDSGHEPVNVKAYFTDICKVDWKLRHLQDIRGKICSITKSDNSEFPIVYTDTIRDTDSLMKFFYRYGRACHIGTTSLKEEAKKEVKLTLKAYEEAGFDIPKNL